MEIVPQEQQHQSGLHADRNKTNYTDEILHSFSKTLKDMQTLVEQNLQAQHHKFERLLRREIDALPELILDRFISEHKKGVDGKFHMRSTEDFVKAESSAIIEKTCERTVAQDSRKESRLSTDATNVLDTSVGHNLINSADETILPASSSPRHQPMPKSPSACFEELEGLAGIEDEETHMRVEEAHRFYMRYQL